MRLPLSLRLTLACVMSEAISPNFLSSPGSITPTMLDIRAIGLWPARELGSSSWLCDEVDGDRNGAKLESGLARGGRRDSSAMAANSAADAVDVARLRAEPRRVLANRVGDEARREVAVVALDHSGISVAEVSSDDHQWHSAHDGERRPGVAQPVKRDARLDRCPLHGFRHRANLPRLWPMT